MATGLLLIVVGLLGGWLVNYLADCLPARRGIRQPVCGHCASQMSWNGYLRFRACPACGRSRGFRTYLVQLGIPAILGYLWLSPPHQLEFPLAVGLVLYLALITVIDVEHRLILHITSAVGALIGLGLGTHLHGLTTTLIGGAAGYLIMLLFYLLGELFVRYLSKRRGEPISEVALGYGDVNLAGIAGLLLGWPGIVFGLLFAILAGGLASLVVVASMLIRRQYRSFSAIPYGPFLVLGIAVLLLRP